MRCLNDGVGHGVGRKGVVAFRVRADIEAGRINLL